jgi:hypothetical protein
MLALTNAPRYDGLELSTYSINDGRPPKGRVRAEPGVGAGARCARLARPARRCQMRPSYGAIVATGFRGG